MFGDDDSFNFGITIHLLCERQDYGDVHLLCERHYYGDVDGRVDNVRNWTNVVC
jgi:hypothetical protein